MPLSPADFYAYSQATGAPVADTPEERARQARDVYEFRQQQLQAPRQESNIFDTIAKTALAAGTLAGGYGLYRTLRNNPVSKVTTQPINTNNVQNVRRASTYREAPVSNVTSSSSYSRPVVERPEAKGNYRVPDAYLYERQIDELPGPYYDRAPAAVSSATVDLNAVKPDVAVQRNTPVDIWESNETYPEVKNVLKTTVQLPPASQRLLNPDFASQFLETNKQDYLRQKNLEQGRLTQQAYQKENARQARDVANENTAFHNDLDNLILDVQTEPDVPTAGSVVNPHQFAQETLVQMQNAQATDITSQSVAAVGSAEDQMTGRVKNQLQRNEDLDLGQIELLENHATQQHNAMMEEMDEPINSVARQLPDGLPMDQAEGLDLTTGKRFTLNVPGYREGLQPGMEIQLTSPVRGRSDLSLTSAAKFLQSERDVIADELIAKKLNPVNLRIEKELSKRLGSQAFTYGPKYTARKQALQLGATYNPQFFDNMFTESVDVLGGTLPTVALKEPTVMKETSQNLLERVGRKKDWLGNIRLEEQNRQLNLGNQLTALAEEDVQLAKEAKAIAQTTGNLPSYYSSPEQAELGKVIRSTGPSALDIVLDRQDAIDQRIDELQTDLFLSAKRVSKSQESNQKLIAGMKLPNKLKSNILEGVRLYGERDSEGYIVPGTQEIRGERQMKDTPKKGGGGRNVAEYSAGSRDSGEDYSPEYLINAIQSLRDPRGYQNDPLVPNLNDLYPSEKFTDDRTQTGRRINSRGVELIDKTTLRNPYEFLDKETLQMMSLMGTDAEIYNANKVLKEQSAIGGGIRSQPLGYKRYEEEKLISPEQARASVDLSEKVRKGLVSVIPTRQSSSQPQPSVSPSNFIPQASRVAKEEISMPPRQLNFPSDVVGNAPARITAADVAARQLESYMSKLQRGRSTPLTSEVRIQRRLF